MMLKRPFVLWCLLLMSYSGLIMNAQSFHELQEKIASMPPAAADAAVIKFIEEAGGLPILEQDTLIFMAQSPFTAPKIMSGFNGFLSPRYISDSTAGGMHRINETSWYYYKQNLEPDARIYYQFHSGGRTYNDPLNPRLGLRFNMINSEFRMPEFAIDDELIGDQFIARGNVQRLTYQSGNMGHDRTVHVYTPPGYEDSSQKYPTAYFHDGTVYVDWGKVPQILDYLIAHKKIRPIIAVFDDPVERGKEYRGDPNYNDYISKELVPYIDMKYRTLALPQERAVIGGSRGGLSSLILSHSNKSFSKCGTFSPAIHPRGMDDFISFLSNAQSKPQEVYIVGAIYDHIWYGDAIALKEYFENASITFGYQDISQGHNIQSWINYLDNLLISFFPITLSDG